MKYLFLLLLIVFTLSSFSQTKEKEFYRGQKRPFTICFMSIGDSTIEVEYFFRKSGGIFGHIPSKQLVIGIDSNASKPIYKSIDDSIKVILKSKHYLIKRRGYKNIMGRGAKRVKVYKSTDTQTEISVLRNNYRLSVFYHSLYNEYKLKPNFNEQKFWDNLQSYELKKYLTLDNIEFDKKIVETRVDIEKNWL